MSWVWLVVERLELGDDFLGVGGRCLEQPASAAPISGDDNHLDVGGLPGDCFDNRGGFIFGAGLEFVLAGGGVNGEPAAVGQAVEFFAIEVDGGLERGAGEMAFAEEDDGGIVRAFGGVDGELGFDGSGRCGRVGCCGLLLGSRGNGNKEQCG